MQCGSMMRVRANPGAGRGWPQRLPDLPADEILWRFHFMLGTIDYSASNPPLRAPVRLT